MNKRVVIEMSIDDYQIIDRLISASIRQHLHYGDGPDYEKARKAFEAWRKA